MTDEVECKILLPWKKTELSRIYTDFVRLSLSQPNDDKILGMMYNWVYDFPRGGDGCKLWHAIANGTDLGDFDTAEAAMDAVDEFLIKLGYRLLNEDDNVMLLL